MTHCLVAGGTLGAALSDSHDLAKNILRSWWGSETQVMVITLWATQLLGHSGIA